MTTPIEYLDENDGVAKTEYTRTVAGEGNVTVEMWHDVESLQRIAERAITKTAPSQKSMEAFAEDKALAVRKTTTSFKAMYPSIPELLKDVSDKSEDYEYKVDDSE